MDIFVRLIRWYLHRSAPKRQFGLDCEPQSEHVFGYSGSEYCRLDVGIRWCLLRKNIERFSNSTLGYEFLHVHFWVHFFLSRYFCERFSRNERTWIFLRMEFFGGCRRVKSGDGWSRDFGRR